MKTNENTKRTENGSLAQLVAKAKTGDQAAFSELYDRTSTELYRSIRAMTRDEDLSWDIQQDSYLRAFQSLDKLENDEAFLPWLRRIAANVTATKMSKRLPVTFTDLTGDDGDDAIPELPDLNAANQPELSLDRKETSRLVKEILSRLPEGQQMVLGMRYYDELSVKEIAALLKLSDGTVKAALFQGRKKVEAAVRALEKQGVKLYGLSPVAFLLALMKQQSVPAQRSEAVLASTLAKAGIAAGTKAAASAAAPVVLHATRPFFTTVVGKVVLAVIAAGVVAGGVAGYRWAKNNLFEKTEPILMVDSSEDLQTDPTAPTVPVEVDVTGPTLPITRDDTAEDLVTEPVVTEPTETEPTVTEPSATEPTEPDAYSGSYGENLTWRFDPNTGLLTIEGSGAMADNTHSEEYPWFAYRDLITGVVFSEGLTVIGGHAFEEYVNLASVAFPSSLTEIRNCAFQKCSALTSLSFPEGLSKIKYGAFAFCEGLQSVTLPRSLTEFDTDCFLICENLEEIHFDPDNPNYRSIDGVVFDKAGATLIACPNGRTGSYSIPEGVETIGIEGFARCTKLTDVEFPESLTQIETQGFFNCVKLTDLELPKNLASIGVAAFAYCYDLTSVQFPEGLTLIDGEAFLDCPNLLSVTIPSGVTNIYYQTFGYVTTNRESPNWTDPMEDFTIYGAEGSAAQAYAEENGFQFIAQ